RRGATELSPCRRNRASDDALGGRRRVEELRPMHRLLPARLQLPAKGLGAVRARDLELRRPRGAAPLSLRLHRVERQPQRAPGAGAGGARHAAPPRHFMTETAGPRDEAWRLRLLAGPAAPEGQSVAFDPTNPPEGVQNFQILDFERQASFFLTGGLVAVHSAG